jgi:hypothetical protein
MTTTSSPTPNIATKQSSLPFFNLPWPEIVETELRGRDIRIRSAFEPLEKNSRDACNVYKALLLMAAEASPETAKSDLPYPYIEVTVGYARLIQYVAGEYQSRLSKRALQRAIEILKRFCYIQRRVKAHDGVIPTTYAVLTTRAVMEMFGASGCTHFRVLQGGKVQLIRPPMTNALRDGLE